jgi:hypothetical protein
MFPHLPLSVFLDLLIKVASKCGVAVFEDDSVTNSPTHIKTYMDGTIERLGFTPDLYYLHRIDPGMCADPTNLPFSKYAISPEERYSSRRIHSRIGIAPKGRQDQIYWALGMLGADTSEGKLK